MDTPEDTRRSYEHAYECSKYYKDPTNDPQFAEALDNLLWLIHKYGRHVIQLLLKDDRIFKAKDKENK